MTNHSALCCVGAFICPWLWGSVKTQSLSVVPWMSFKFSRGHNPDVSLNCRPEGGHPFLFSSSSSDDDQAFTHRMWPHISKNKKQNAAATVPLREKRVFSFTEMEKEIFSFSSHLLFSHPSDRRWISARLNCHWFPEKMRLFSQRLSYQNWLQKETSFVKIKMKKRSTFSCSELRWKKTVRSLKLL